MCNNRHALEGSASILCHQPPGFENHRMRKVVWAFAGLIVVFLGALGAVLAFDAPMKPPPLASISEPFADVDFSDLPTVQTYAARDGAKLGYRVYEGGGAQVVVLIHGSSDDGAGMHPLAKTLRDAGASVYVPVVRGHGNFGRTAMSIISANLRTISPISSRCCGRSIPTPAFHSSDFPRAAALFCARSPPPTRSFSIASS
jgi:hypothetical protein